MKTIKITDHQSTVLQDALNIAANHLEAARLAPEAQALYASVTALIVAIEVQLEESSTYADKELGYE